MTTTKEANKFNNKSNIRVGIFLGLIILLGAYLRFYQLGAHSIGNTYYAATVQSMLTSWKNFFFAAFEPGGSVTVDKPPFGFWVQAISAYLFGVNGFALALPQALAGVLSIPLLYVLVKKHFGVYPGLVSALVLAVVPVTVATERNNTMDGLLVFVLLLAAWAFLKATESGRLRYLFLGAFLVGLGFNIKMLQAFMPIPAFYGIYLIGVKHAWWKRVVHLSAASIVLLVVSLSWAVVVDLVPADERPFIGSSTNNTVMELIVGHNGLSRLGLNQNSPNRNASQNRDDGQALQAPPNGQQSFGPPAQGSSPQNSPPPRNDQAGNTRPAPPTNNRPNQQGTGAPSTGNRGNGRNNEVGEAGISRLFSKPLVIEMSWVLPFALLGSLVALTAYGWSWPLHNKHLGLLFWLGWMLPSLAYFSLTTGLFHRYYLIMVGPPLAALVGISVDALSKILKKNRWLGVGLISLLSGITIAFEASVLNNLHESSQTVFIISILLWVTGIGLVIWGAWKKKGQVAALCIVVASMLVAPFTWSLLTTLSTNPNVSLPTAGVNTSQGNPPNAPDLLMNPQTENILDYLLAHTESDSYLVATSNARQAAPFILATSRPVLTFGGFTGRDNVISVEAFIEMVEQGDLRYVLGLPQEKREIAQWMTANCAIINPTTGRQITANNFGGGNRPNNPQNRRAELYDCGIS